MASVSDLRRGQAIVLDGDPWVVTTFEFVKPGKGQGLYRTKLRNAITGGIIERTFRSGDSIDLASLETRKMHFLYRE